MSNLNAWTPRVLSILRVLVALSFMSHGLMKLWGIPAPQPGVPDPLPFILTIAAWLEVVGGALLVLGLFTRPVAFILCGQMAWAFLLAHAKSAGTIVPALNQGEAAYLFCFIFLYFVFAGGGEWSLDRIVRKKD
ncbi:DoxX family protein [Caulobacter mirabilis]|uniref:DoxX family protein n=1 Tax=Caulobacter mirabilis TaxID=69666 RepID=A0A2D2AYA8_9CAUL|nr:DoxX family protein [Caulobacter mirabilis]ATQ42996.1 DoxX family protein [Caulobacter mirabilis]